MENNKGIVNLVWDIFQSNTPQIFHDARSSQEFSDVSESTSLQHDNEMWKDFNVEDGNDDQLYFIKNEYLEKTGDQDDIDFSQPINAEAEGLNVGNDLLDNEQEKIGNVNFINSTIRENPVSQWANSGGEVSITSLKSITSGNTPQTPQTLPPPTPNAPPPTTKPPPQPQK